jgi:hypothetical protein
MDLLNALSQTGDVSLIHNAISKLEIFNNAKSTAAFIDHSLKLASITASATDRAFGLHLLTLAAHHVHQSIFIENVSPWGQVALDVVRIQPKKPSSSTIDDTTTTSHLLLVAAWKCLGALFHRVDQLFIQSSSSSSSSNALPGIKRDASALVPKLVASLRFINSTNNNNKKQSEDNTTIISSSPNYYSPDDEELSTLLQAIKTVPVAFRQHTSLLQQHLQPLALLHGNKLAMQCVASLPAAASPTDTDPATNWSSLAQSILKTIHSHLDVVVIGTIENNYINTKKSGGSDDGDIASIAKQAIDPASTPLLPPPPSSIGSYTSSQLTSSLSVSLHSVHLLDTLLTQPFNVGVAVPSTAIVLLVTRILAAINTKRMKMMLIKDASSSSSFDGGGGGGSIMTRQRVYMGMVEMQISALLVLEHLIDVAGTTLTPLFGHVGRLLADCLDTHIITSSTGGGDTTLEEQLLTACKVFVSSAGLGAVKTLGSVLLKCVEMILYGQVAAIITTGDGDENKKRSKGRGQQPPPQKKARITTTTINMPTHNSSSISITTQVAALQALEALLSISGGGLTHQQRSRGDALSLHLSLTTHSATSSLVINSHLKPLQTAAYQCLLASILCTAAPFRPAYLPQAMQLFASGLHDSWQPLAAVCAHGVVCCEAFLHPRSVPLGKYMHIGRESGGGSKPLLLSSMNDGHDDDEEGGFVEFGMPLFWQNNSNNDDDDFLSEQQQERRRRRRRRRRR